MGKFDGVLLVSDFDGTLCAKGGVIPPDDLRALEFFRAEGGRFTVATGRTPMTFGRYAKPLGINAPAVLFNGSALYDFDAGKPLLHAALCADVAGDLAALCREMPELGFEAHCWENVYVFRPNWVTDYHVDLVCGMDYTACEIGEMPLPWTKVIVQQDHETLLLARQWMRRHGWEERYETVFSLPLFLELVAKGCSKGAMVKRLADLMSIRPENIYCVGDGENDLSMLSVSAALFAPADCAEAVRRSGARLVRACGEGAVAHVVEILDQRYT